MKADKGVSSPALKMKSLLKAQQGAVEPRTGPATTQPSTEPHLPLLCHLASARHPGGEEMFVPPLSIQSTHSGGKVKDVWLIYRVEPPTPQPSFRTCPSPHFSFPHFHPDLRNPSIHFLSLWIFSAECLIHRHHLRLSVMDCPCCREYW